VRVKPRAFAAFARFAICRTGLSSPVRDNSPERAESLGML
jgi:hypothetical protein